MSIQEGVCAVVVLLVIAYFRKNYISWELIWFLKDFKITYLCFFMNYLFFLTFNFEGLFFGQC